MINIYVSVNAAYGTGLGGCFYSHEQTQRNHSDQKQKSFTSTTHRMCVVVMKEEKKNYRGKYFQPVRLQRLLELIQSANTFGIYKF